MSNFENPETAATAKVIAMYFPQLHIIPENDEWWGKGFTDWVNVKAAKPYFSGHDQPRVPQDGSYYDQADIEVIRAQVALAKAHGVWGFCHYHYWFDGKQLLETPTELMLANKDIDMPFCLSWANETWSRRWDGRDREILIRQTHPASEDRWRAHFNYLVRLWRDPRAIKIDGKPVFCIYRPQNIPEIDRMLDCWRKWAEEEGLPGIYIVMQKQYGLADTRCLQGFDGAFQFQPFEAIYSADYGNETDSLSGLYSIARLLPKRVQALLHSLRDKAQSGMKFHDYESVWEAVVKERPQEGLDTFPGGFVDWDNTARYKERATVFRGSSPERFEYWMRQLIATLPDRNLPEPFVFINAWNEWAESAYLEPDKKHGIAYLEALKKALAD